MLPWGKSCSLQLVQDKGKRIHCRLLHTNTSHMHCQCPHTLHNWKFGQSESCVYGLLVDWSLAELPGCFRTVIDGESIFTCGKCYANLNTDKTKISHCVYNKQLIVSNTLIERQTNLVWLSPDQWWLLWCYTGTEIQPPPHLLGLLLGTCLHCQRKNSCRSDLTAAQDWLSHSTARDDTN